MYLNDGDEARQWHELLARVRVVEHQRDQMARLILEEHNDVHEEAAMWCTAACRMAISAQRWGPGTMSHVEPNGLASEGSGGTNPITARG